MASSDAKFAANRANAQKSTGPQSQEGKARSAQNATKHGLLSCRVLLLPGEDPEAWAAFCERCVDDLNPVGELEEAHVERITGLVWRLRRVAAAEAGVLRVTICDAQERRLRPNREKSLDQIFYPLPPAATEQSRALLAQRDHDENNLGRAVASDLGVMVQLSRYEVQLERSLHKAMAALARAQDERRQRTARAASATGPIVDAEVVDGVPVRETDAPCRDGGDGEDATSSIVRNEPTDAANTKLP